MESDDIDAMDDVVLSPVSYQTATPQGQFPSPSNLQPGTTDDPQFEPDSLVRVYSDPIHDRLDGPTHFSVSSPGFPDRPIRSLTLPEFTAASTVIPNRRQFFGNVDAVPSKKRRFVIIESTDISARRTNPNVILKGNNTYGRKGKPRCLQCRAWRQKVGLSGVS
jgi:hypothetical protein